LRVLKKMIKKFIRCHFQFEFFVLVWIIFSFMLAGCSKKSAPAIPEDKKIALANTYYNTELYEAAVNEYLDYVNTYPLDQNRQANIYYIIANIYFERVKDYNKALEFFYRVKYLYPESNLQGEVGKRIVNCLERLQRSQDAQRTLEKEAALEPEKVEEHRPGEIVASIGSKNITAGDLEFEISQLPPYLQSQFGTRDKKLEFLQQYIVGELLYDSAKRKGLEKDKDIIEGTFQAQKRLMAQKILNEEIQSKINISQADVELYYKANKEKYTEKDDKGKVVKQKSFQEAAQQVAQDLLSEKQQDAYRQLVARLMQSENVTIFEKRIK
jgi:tetratricopeptide (TPR) repeat protein